jgi:hypothetical protein
MPGQNYFHGGSLAGIKIYLLKTFTRSGPLHLQLFLAQPTKDYKIWTSRLSVLLLSRNVLFLVHYEGIPIQT